MKLDSACRTNVWVSTDQYEATFSLKKNKLKPKLDFQRLRKESRFEPSNNSAVSNLGAVRICWEGSLSFIGQYPHPLIMEDPDLQYLYFLRAGEYQLFA